LEYRYALERNLHIYEWYLPLSRVYFFTPIYFLFFSSRFSIGQVLVLGSIYYFTVVLVELPSGYLSDRLGRAVALRLSAASLSVSYVLFLVGGESFPTFVVAQIALGVGYASISGTDTALHFDTLVRLGREAEFAEREQRLIRNGYAAGALGALLAGAVAQQEL
jgi:MFS family permease